MEHHLKSGRVITQKEIAYSERRQKGEEKRANECGRKGSRINRQKR